MSLIDLDRQLMASPLSVDMMMTSLNFDTDASIAPIFSGESDLCLLLLLLLCLRDSGSGHLALVVIKLAS